MSSMMSTALVKKIAQLAQLSISDEQAANLVSAFDDTLGTVAKMQEVDVTSIEPTHQVTGLENVLREDVVDQDWMLSQDEALANAPQTHQGLFVVPRILDND